MATFEQRTLNQIDGAWQGQILFTQTQFLQEHNDVVQTIRETLQKCAEDDEEVLAPQCQELADMLQSENYDRIKAYELINMFRLSDKLRPLAIVLKLRLNYAIDDDETLKYNLNTLKQALDKNSPNYNTNLQTLNKLIEYSDSNVGEMLSSTIQTDFHHMIKNFKDTNYILAREIQEYLQHSTNDAAENLDLIFEDYPFSDDDNAEDSNDDTLYITPSMLDILRKMDLVQDNPPDNN